jgi:hypothetical protein
MFKKKIARGVALLGPDQVARIDLRKLDMRGDRYCILGQLYGKGQTGADDLGIWGKLPEYGFSLDWCRGGFPSERNWDRLTQEWKDAVRKARKPPS